MGVVISVAEVGILLIALRNKWNGVVIARNTGVLIM